VYGVKIVASFNGEKTKLTVKHLTRRSIVRKVEFWGELNQSDLINLAQGHVMTTWAKEIISSCFD
jgi:hypothetical protein